MAQCVCCRSCGNLAVVSNNVSYLSYQLTFNAINVSESLTYVYLSRSTYNLFDQLGQSLTKLIDFLLNAVFFFVVVVLDEKKVWDEIDDHLHRFVELRNLDIVCWKMMPQFFQYLNLHCKKIFDAERWGCFFPLIMGFFCNLHLSHHIVTIEGINV